ncbi:VOC family protein [Nakamurella flava]|uniref:VOC family protein n=1 Tax=Nakamurella flava TaxID=2576308 RepID=A0A4U6QKJ6_9ACTN|nr:VOC family protein [Nakamurella flava]TKV60646.1 VOC family protein [Nakamurella flava]
MAVAVQIVLDCAHPSAQAAFWQIALDYRLDPPPPGFTSWDDAKKAWGLPEDWDQVSAISDPDGVGPRLFFQQVPEGKTVKNRLHLDVSVGRGIQDPEERWATVVARVERLTAAGAAVVEERRHEHGDHWMVMTDPEGNEFCVQ